MTYFFITGDSSGIGEALKKIVLEDEKNHVFGISRRSRAAMERYQAIQLDLSNYEAVIEFTFPELKDAKRIVLVNNAGQIGPIKPLFEQSAEEIQQVFQVNTSSLAILSAKFIQQYSNLDLLIINISSGAAKNPIQAWSTYCASKAAVDMLSSTLIEDLKFRGKDNVKVYSVSPGVIDTEMQGAIRASKKENFDLHERFDNLKKDGELVLPHTAAQLIYKIYSEPTFFQDHFISLRDYY